MTDPAAPADPTRPADDGRKIDLQALKLAALVRAQWPDLPATAEKGPFPDGGALVDAEGGRAWFLLGEGAEHRLGAALAVARRAGVEDAHLLLEDADAAGVLARRASQFARPPQVWLVDGLALSPVAAAAPAVEPALPPQAELYRPIFAAAGLDAVVEGGILLGEYLGLELARVVVDLDGSAHVETGVGRFDREASALVFAHEEESAALARVVELASRWRAPDAERHPLNTMVTERWLRTALVREPSLVGARTLEPASAAVPRRNLLDPAVASAKGVDLDGRPIVVTCSTGVYLDLVPAAADDRLAHDPEAHLILAVPSRDAVPVTVELAAWLARPATVVSLDEGWRHHAPGVG